MHRDTFFKAHELHGNLTLVVVHGDHAVVAAFFANGAHKGCVGREGAVGGDACLLRHLYTWRNDFDFFIAIVAVVAVVGVQATNSQTRLRLARGLQGLGNHFNGVKHFLAAEQLAHFFQCHMGRDAGSPEVLQHIEFAAHALVV